MSSCSLLPRVNGSVECLITRQNIIFRLNVIYCPPPQKKNYLFRVYFFRDWSLYLDQHLAYHIDLFNVYLDNQKTVVRHSSKVSSKHKCLNHHHHSWIKSCQKRPYIVIHFRPGTPTSGKVFYFHRECSNHIGGCVPSTSCSPCYWSGGLWQ